MSKQTSYTQYTGDTFAGILDGLRTAAVIRTGVLESASLGFGHAVVQGTKDRQVVAGIANAKILGISERQIDREQEVRPGDGSVLYKAGEGVSIIEDGYVWVTVVAGAAVIGESPFIHDTTGAFYGGTAAGATVQATNAEFRSTAAVGELALVRVNNKI